MPTLTAPRRDALPEGYDYRDDGCELSPSCLNCPLAVCKYDLPGAAARYAVRQGEMIDLFHRGVSSQDIAARFGISKRSVNRALVAERHRCANVRLRNDEPMVALPEPGLSYPEYTQFGFLPDLHLPRRRPPRQRRTFAMAVSEMVTRSQSGDYEAVTAWLRDLEVMLRGSK